jgi:hypothetical protein
MLKYFTDFNARTKSGECWNLVHDGVDITDAAVAKKAGDRILLYQDDDDFEVEATLDYRFVDELKQCQWVALPDWSTKKQVRRRAQKAAE